MSTMSDFVQLVKDQYTAIPTTQIDVSGKVFIVTGANTGLGFYAAEELVRNGASRVHLAVRTISKGEAARRRIEATTGRTGVVGVLQVDMSERQSILDLAARVSELDRVDGVIANAAVALTDHTTASAGLETTVYVNAVGTMLLAALLVPVLARSAARHPGSEPVLSIVGSELAVFARSRAAAAPLHDAGEDVNVLTLFRDRDMSSRYGLTKLLLLWAYTALAAENPVARTGVTINYTNPGLCHSELGRDASWSGRAAVSVLRAVLARSSAAGGHIMVLSALAGRASHGMYLTNAVVHQDRITDYIKNDEGRRLQARVWADTQKWF